jgi:hypothetical protein
MSSTRHWIAAALAIAAYGAPVAQAATAWSEATQGDLSNSGLAPTPVAMVPGSNVVIGTTGDAGQGVDRDYFVFTVPVGSTLDAINLLNTTGVSGSVSFIALQPGPQVTVSTSGAGSQALIAYGHYGNDQIGTDLLPSIKVGSPGALPAGTYSVWIQETGGAASYGMDFVIGAGSADVPALPGLALLVLGASLVTALVHIQGRRGNATGYR